MEHLTAFLTRMPKVELHVHLESTMPGEMLARFAARQGRELPRPAERLYDCSAEDLSDFLAFLDNICSFVGTPEELAEAAEHAALESGREHILYSEMILNPTHWPQFSVPEIIAAVTAGFDRAAAQGGADCRFTLSLSRTQTGAEAMALVEDMKAHRTHRLAGLSIDGNEALAGRTGGGSVRRSWRRVRRASAAPPTPGRAAGRMVCGTPWISWRRTGWTTASGRQRTRI